MMDLDELDRIEREAWSDMFAASPPPFTAGAGLASRGFDGATAFAIRAAPAIQFNRAQVASLERLSDSALDAVLDWLIGNCGPVWALQTASPDTSRLAARGLRAASSWTKFRRPSADAPEAATALEIRAVDPSKAQDFGATVQAGFGAPPPFAFWAAALVGRPRWTTYVAYDGSVPVAAAALFVDGGTGWLGLGCCLPSHRGRGAQSALLARRIADAQRAGAITVVTETGTPPPGEEAAHPSFRNIRRAGFEPAYARLNFQPAGQLA